MRAYSSNGTPLAWLSMTLGERIEARRKALGVKSQAELARMAGIGQSTMSGLIRKPYRWSPYLTKIARALETSVEYLLGETDDPELGAPQPSPAPRLQHVTMPVALPTEDALADGFEAVLSVSEDMDRAELARELAKQLPGLLRLAATAAAVQPMARQAAQAAAAQAPPPAARQRRRA